MENAQTTFKVAAAFNGIEVANRTHEFKTKLGAVSYGEYLISSLGFDFFEVAEIDPNGEILRVFSSETQTWV